MKTNNALRLTLAICAVSSLCLLGGCGSKDADTTPPPPGGAKSVDATDTGTVKKGGGEAQKAPFDPSK